MSVTGGRVTVKQARKLVDRVLNRRADAFYADGKRVRLDQARLATTSSMNSTMFLWRGVRIKRAGTITHIVVGGTLVEIQPRAVAVGMTFSASVPVIDIAGAWTS
jgi:hypothetical protein